MIVNEIDNIPPHSVPVIIKEITYEQENKHDILDIEKSSSISESSDSEDSESPFKEIVGEEEGSDEDDFKVVKSRNRMANRRNHVEMEMVSEEDDDN